MYEEIVTVKVGKEPSLKSFPLHKGVLSFYSGYFEAAVKGVFKEAKDGLIELPDESADVFERFVVWLYTRKVDLPDDTNNGFKVICGLWFFADRRDIPLLANYSIDMLRDKIAQTWTVPTAEIRPVYANTMPGAKLRLFIIFMLSNTSGSRILDDGSRWRWEDDALWDMLKAVWVLKEQGITKIMSKEELTALDMCQFHMHEERMKCAKDSDAQTTSVKSAKTSHGQTAGNRRPD